MAITGPILLSRLNIDAPRGRFQLESPLAAPHFESMAAFDAAGCVGTADFATVSMHGTDQEMFAAIYVREDLLVVRLGAVEYAAPPLAWGTGQRYETRQATSFWREIPRFSLTRDGETVFDVEYQPIGPDDGLPGPRARDILFNIAESTKTQREAVRFADFWNALAAGRDPRAPHR